MKRLEPVILMLLIGIGILEPHPKYGMTNTKRMETLPRWGKGITTMDLDGFIASHGPENELIPSVAPADLRNVWSVQRDVRSRFPGQQILMADDVWKRACSPGTDLFAMFYRITFLEMLAEPTEPLSPWLHDGELDDAVFKVFATFPIKRIKKGSQEGFPFDIQELTKQIEKEARREGT